MEEQQTSQQLEEAQEQEQESPTTISLDQSQLEEIYKINNKLIQGKVQYADFQIKIENCKDKQELLKDKIEELKVNISECNSDIDTLEQQVKTHSLQKTQLKLALEEVSRAFQNKINEMAASYGIESNEDVRWNFDLVSGSFVKV
jgi:chromosome segregation ATPase